MATFSGTTTSTIVLGNPPAQNPLTVTSTGLVDVNSASPALLRYVSGMNALTARRVYEHRREKGPFKNREELKQVSGFGDQTFVQAAGFLKVIGGENPLDATWIHPESYDIARRVLEKIGCDVADLAKTVPAVLSGKGAC